MAEPIPFDHGLDRLSLDYIINISYMSRSTTTPGRLVGRLGRTETEGMFENKTKVLLILPQDALDRARVLAGKAVLRGTKGGRKDLEWASGSWPPRMPVMLPSLASFSLIPVCPDSRTISFPASYGASGPLRYATA